MGKRYYWLKLKDDFFRQLPMKKLRRIAGGDTYTIIYLKMMLVTTKTDGVLGYDCSEEEFIENLALDIDEDEQNVKVTVQFLIANGLLVPMENGDMLLPEAKAAVGSESASTIRSRECRARQKALQCNTPATLLQQNGSVEIEKEIEIEKDIDTTSSYSKQYISSSADDGSFNLFKAVENAIKIPMTHDLAQLFVALYEEVGEGVLKEALAETVKHGGRSYSYVETVARRIASGGNSKSTNAGAIDWDDARKRILGDEGNGN